MTIKTTEVPLSGIFHFASHNIARPNGFFRDERDQHALVEQLSDGWDVQQGVVAIKAYLFGGLAEELVSE